MSAQSKEAGILTKTHSFSSLMSLEIAFFWFRGYGFIVIEA